MLIDERYLNQCKAFIDNLERRWQSNSISNQKAMDTAMGYFETLVKCENTSPQAKEFLKNSKKQLIKFMCKIQNKEDSIDISNS